MTTDANGEGEVALPDYFEALHRDIECQFSCIGQFAQAIVAREVRNNRFPVRTDKPHGTVSLQVTGVRSDATARADAQQAEQMETEGERGRYLDPEVFGQPVERKIGYVSPGATATTALTASPTPSR